MAVMPLQFDFPGGCMATEDEPKLDWTGRTDHSLLRRFRDGEQDAATALYLKYAGRLEALAHSQTSPVLAARFDPEDVVQSVFRTFFRRASQGLYQVPEGDELWQLLLVLALNKIRGLATHHRAQKRDVAKTSRAEGLDQLHATAPGHTQSSLHVLRMVVDEFLGQLPESHREIATLRIEGYEVNEIAAKTRRSKRTVERVLSSLRDQLFRLVGD